MMDAPELWIGLFNLILLEIILSVDNIIFISILTGKLPEKNRELMRKTGITLAMFFRILLLFSISWLTKLTLPILEVFNHTLTGKDLVFLFGGAFLIAKSTCEIHNNIEGCYHNHPKIAKNLILTIIQIIVFDMLFSLDSIIAAIGIINHVGIIVLSICISSIVMLMISNKVTYWIQLHPTLKILALGFLSLVGFCLIAEGLSLHIAREYLYFAMLFSLSIELINIKIKSRKNRKRTTEFLNN